MNVQESMAFAAIAASRTPAEIKAFSEQLIADSDAVVRYDWLKDNLGKTPKEERQEIYKRLEREIPKYPGMVRHENPVYGKAFLLLRAKMELFRGLKRDRVGYPRLTNEKRSSEVDRLTVKLEEMIGTDADWTIPHGTRAENLKAMIKEHQDFMDGTRKDNGSILDFVFSDAVDALSLPPVKEG